MKRTLIIAIPALCLMPGLHGTEPPNNPGNAAPLGAADRVSARPELVITTLGFGSCARQERPQPIWDAINTARCDAFVLCGDNIYAATANPAVFREKYAMLAAMPGFAKLRETTPLFATWDDHDYGLNQPAAKEKEYWAKEAPKVPPNRFRIHERVYTGSNFGLMRINWEGRTPSLRLEICGLEGKVILHRDVPFPELQAK